MFQFFLIEMVVHGGKLQIIYQYYNESRAKRVCIEINADVTNFE